MLFTENTFADTIDIIDAKEPQLKTPSRPNGWPERLHGPLEMTFKFKVWMLIGRVADYAMETHRNKTHTISLCKRPILMHLEDC